MAKNKALPAALTEHFAKRFGAWVDQHFPKGDGGQVAAAKALGISQAMVSSLASGEKSPGSAVLVEISSAMGESIDALLGRTEIAPGFILDIGERYPEFARACAAARVLGLREDAIQDVREAVYDNPTNARLDANYWFDRIRRDSEIYERGGGRPKKPPFKKHKREL